MGSGMWSPEEWANVVRLRAEGLTWRVVATRIGRRLNTVKSKARWESMDAERREQRARRIKYRKDSLRGRVIKSERPLDTVQRHHRPPPSLIDERERRHAAGPRDLTGAFFGDPPRGYSALERRA